ncbi:TPA: hypothetical protein DCR49_08205 [Candidatus Delongbacteria bacterium]|uniref:DUF3147 family protein n=1 Tax=Candidatus Uhrbacteria bacterium GW2011_GWF2_39_13 TaxID=1618995 RepID=A0A0G0MJW4_9BACT|nr:MAG: hypothetical protein UT30_C0030G0003 [Candidatus Uhrbacteria bacterium GW2011_GWF2_39_13]HAQ61963.1 hypothetical protein [Candidatus Delongbacteria bacterium]
MIYYIVKVVISALVIVAVSEISKRNSTAGALLASLPLLSVLAFVWMYIDTGDVAKISEVSKDVFWLVIPSLVLFIALPVFLKMQINFYLSLFISAALTAGAYMLLLIVLKAKS